MMARTMIRRVAIGFLFITLFSSIAAGSPNLNIQSEVTKSGVAIEVQPTIEREVIQLAEEVAQDFSVNVSQHVFALYVDDGSRYLVLTNMEPHEGKATVTGTLVPPEESGSEVGLIFADSVEINVDGTPVSLNKFKENPTKYEYQLIELTGQFRQIALEEEAGDGSLRYQHSDGAIAIEFQKGTIFGSPAQAARWTAINLSSDELGADYGIGDRIGGFFFGEQAIDLQDTAFWVEARTSVDVVVIPIGNETGLVVAKTVVKEDRTTSVQSIADSGSDDRGDVVSVEADIVGSRLSTKEVLINLAGCAPDAVIVPGAGCVPLVTDVTLHTGFLIGESANRSDVVAYAALSNTPQEKIVRPETGRYQVKGRVVEAFQIDPSLPVGNAILVYQMERVGDLTIEQSTRNQARVWRKSLVKSMKKQINMSDDEFKDYKRELEETPSPSPTATPTPTSMSTPTQTETPKTTPSEPSVESATQQKNQSPTRTPGQPGFAIIASLVGIWILAMLAIWRS